MGDWNKDLGISKKAWEGLKPNQRNRMLNIFNKSPRGKELKKAESKSKSRARKDLKVTKTKRKLKDNVSTAVNAEKIKIRNKRLIEEALESQYRKNNPTSKVTTQGDKATTKFFEFFTKNFLK